MKNKVDNETGIWMVDGRLVVGGFGAWCLELLLGRRWALENPLAHTDKDTMARPAAATATTTSNGIN